MNKMGNKLSSDKSLRSMGEVMHYIRDNETSALRNNVYAIKNGELLIMDEFEVLAFHNEAYATIHIMWEKSGFENYRDLGLYGVYSSSYYQISYHDGVLKINSGDIEITVR